MTKIKYIACALLSLGFIATSCSDDDDYSVATGEIVKSVTTGEAVVTATTATVSGQVDGLAPYASTSYTVGTVYGTSQDVTTSGTRQSGSINTETGTVTTTITGLQTNVTYYYATYVTLQGKVTYFGDVHQLTTSDATITAGDAANITSVSAEVTSTLSLPVDQVNAGSSEIECGLRIARSADEVEDGYDYPATATSQTFNTSLANLLPGQTYYYAAYFSLGDGIVFSETKSFTTATKEMEYVDLGLSVLWAKYNLGGERETDLGGLYGYGDVTGLNTSEIIGSYGTGNIAGTAADIACAISPAIDGGTDGTSTMPTNEQVAELLANTTQEFVEIDGVSGLRLTAANGNYIFLPAAGIRTGEEASGQGTEGHYWTGSINSTDDSRAQTLSFTSTGASAGTALRYVGQSIRTVKKTAGITVNVSKLAVGDIENNGRMRIEIYNQYGETASDPGLNLSDIVFNKNITVRFTISGIDGNLKSGAATSHIAGLQFADSSWAASYWSAYSGDKYDAQITGDGEYEVWAENIGAGSGAAVFCVDIDGLSNDLTDPSQFRVESLTIFLDEDK